MMPAMLATWIITLILAVTIHEVSHGWVAYKLGDPTAKHAGRLTLNPLAHIDPFGTIIFPLTLIIFGMIMSVRIVPLAWAKPVPINFRNLRNPKTDMILVGLAGPMANFILAILGSIAIKAGISNSGSLYHPLPQFIMINLILGVFNLVPIPPLDGSRVIMGLLPRNLSFAYASLGRYGLLIIIILLYMGILQRIIWPIVAILLSVLLAS